MRLSTVQVFYFSYSNSTSALEIPKETYQINSFTDSCRKIQCICCMRYLIFFFMHWDSFSTSTKKQVCVQTSYCFLIFFFLREAVSVCFSLITQYHVHYSQKNSESAGLISVIVFRTSVNNISLSLPTEKVHFTYHKYGSVWFSYDPWHQHKISLTCLKWSSKWFISVCRANIGILPKEIYQMP